eukprot:892250-Amphidinium_carterae.1
MALVVGGVFSASENCYERALASIQPTKGEKEARWERASNKTLEVILLELLARHSCFVMPPAR